MRCESCGLSEALCACAELQGLRVAPTTDTTTALQALRGLHPTSTRSTSVTTPGNGATRNLRNPTPRVWTADELVDAELPEPQWAVPGLIPEGFSLLVASPKVGKSWLALGVVLDKASGKLVLGSIESEPSGALYMALEDVPRRLQERISDLVGDDAPPTGAHFVTDWPSGADGALLLDQWLTDHPDVKVVVLDVIVRMREINARGDTYADDYALGALLKGIADKHAIALVGIHHTRKAQSDDFIHSVSGTQGLAGAADAILVLRRGRNEAAGILDVTGRDLEERQHGLVFDQGRWTLSEKPTWILQSSEGRRRIITYLTVNGPSKPKAVATALDMKPTTARSLLHRMAKDELVTVTDGNYGLVNLDLTLDDDPLQTLETSLKD
jgi:hypothetical protein